jgi:hypothetical protein
MPERIEPQPRSTMTQRSFAGAVRDEKRARGPAAYRRREDAAHVLDIVSIIYI